MRFCCSSECVFVCVCASASMFLPLSCDVMWYPPQNNIVLHSPHSLAALCVLFASCSSESLVAAFFLVPFPLIDECSVCVWTVCETVCVSESYWWCIYNIHTKYFSFFGLCVCVFSVCSNLEMFYKLNSPKTYKPIQTAFTLLIIADSIRFFLVFISLSSRDYKLKFYIFSKSDY